jgi:2-keto-3-deoxy-L-rhamnonate aldolase RhmA
MRAKLTKARLAAAAVVTAAMIAASPSVLGQSCPSTATAGCNIPGLTVPNGLDICLGTGTNVHADLSLKGKFTQLCNTQAIDPTTWVYGLENDLTPAQQTAPFWSKMMTAMAQGQVVKGTRWGQGTGSGPTGSDYCNVATYNATNNVFTWADQRHAALDNSTLWANWRSATVCGLTLATTAAPGALGSSLDERESQHDADGGAIVFFRPVNSVRDAQEAIFWIFWPPFGHRSQGGAPSTYDSAISAAGAGPYRASYNMNAVLIAHIATVAGAQAADGIAALDGIDGLYLDQLDLQFQAAGVADYNTLAAGVQTAARAHGKYLCTVNTTVTPEVMTCVPPAQLSAADMAKREWPLRRLDANGMPWGSTRLAGNN